MWFWCIVVVLLFLDWVFGECVGWIWLRLWCVLSSCWRLVGCCGGCGCCRLGLGILCNIVLGFWSRWCSVGRSWLCSWCWLVCWLWNCLLFCWCWWFGWWFCGLVLVGIGCCVICCVFDGGLSGRCCSRGCWLLGCWCVVCGVWSDGWLVGCWWIGWCSCGFVGLLVCFLCRMVGCDGLLVVVCLGGNCLLDGCCCRMFIFVEVLFICVDVVCCYCLGVYGVVMFVFFFGEIVKVWVLFLLIWCCWLLFCKVNWVLMLFVFLVFVWCVLNRFIYVVWCFMSCVFVFLFRVRRLVFLVVKFIVMMLNVIWWCWCFCCLNVKFMFLLLSFCWEWVLMWKLVFWRNCCYRWKRFLVVMMIMNWCLVCWWFWYCWMWGWLMWWCVCCVVCRVCWIVIFLVCNWFVRLFFVFCVVSRVMFCVWWLVGIVVMGVWLGFCGVFILIMLVCWILIFWFVRWIWVCWFFIIILRWWFLFCFFSIWRVCVCIRFGVWWCRMGWMLVLLLIRLVMRVFCSLVVSLSVILGVCWVRKFRLFVVSW